MNPVYTPIFYLLLRSILLLSYHLRLDLPSGPFSPHNTQFFNRNLCITNYRPGWNLLVGKFPHKRKLQYLNEPIFKQYWTTKTLCSIACTILLTLRSQFVKAIFPLLLCTLQLPFYLQIMFTNDDDDDYDDGSTSTVLPRCKIKLPRTRSKCHRVSATEYGAPYFRPALAARIRIRFASCHCSGLGIPPEVRKLLMDMKWNLRKEWCGCHCTERAGRINDPDASSGGMRFESWSGDHVSWWLPCFYSVPQAEYRVI
jgi:hypothetical protein